MTGRIEMTTGLETRAAGARCRATPGGRAEAEDASLGGRASSPALGHVALVVWAILVIVPLLWTFLAVVQEQHRDLQAARGRCPSSFGFDASAGPGPRRTSAGTSSTACSWWRCSTSGTMLLGSMAAYVLARYKFFGNRVIYYMFVSGLAFPVFLALVPLFFVVQNLGALLGHAHRRPGPGLHRVLAAVHGLLPGRVLQDAADVGGRGGDDRRRLAHPAVLQVMLPMAKPGLISITIFNIIGQWTQYILPVALMQGADGKEKWVLTQGIADISVAAGYEADWAALFAALTMAILPMIIVYAFFQRQIQPGLTAGAVK